MTTSEFTYKKNLAWTCFITETSYMMGDKTRGLPLHTAKLYNI